jgi:hypothetical protein
MTETTFDYRDEIAVTVSKLMDYLKEQDDAHYDIRPGAYAPEPFINIVTTDIDYVDGTRLENFLRIVKENITMSQFIWGVEGCKIIVETNTGTRIDAFGQKVRFYFFKNQKEETK